MIIKDKKSQNNMLKSICNSRIFALTNQSVLKHKNTMNFWALTRIGWLY